jgi:hypothetical protein
MLNCFYFWNFSATHLVPVFVGELLARVSPLDACAVHQNLRLEPLTGQCGHDVFDGFPISQFGDVDPRFTTETIDNLVFG